MGQCMLHDDGPMTQKARKREGILDSHALHRRFELARALDKKGKDDEAQTAYLRVLEDDSRHLPSLLALASLLAKTRRRAAAKTTLLRAVEVGPLSPAAHTLLATLLADAGEVDKAGEHYQTALQLDPGYSDAHKGLAVLLLRQGEVDQAEQHASRGFRGRASAWDYRGQGHPVTLLLILSALGGNIPIDAFVEDRRVRKSTLVAEFCDPRAELPPHDLVWNAVGDADLCSVALERALEILKRTRAPVINSPLRVGRTGRAYNAARLGRIPGVVTARTILLTRNVLQGPRAEEILADHGLRWPLLLRSPGFQTGRHFVRVERPELLPRAVDELPGQALLAMQFIDTSSSDGWFRKYRVMTIGGTLYPLHLAISRNWKVHYFSAQMADHPKHRAEEEVFLRDMKGALGQPAIRALEQIQETLGLDYGGCDFALDAQGRVILFEANATMVILDPGLGFGYRGEAVEQARRAVTELVRRTAGVPIEPS